MSSTTDTKAPTAKAGHVFCSPHNIGDVVFVLGKDCKVLKGELLSVTFSHNVYKQVIAEYEVAVVRRPNSAPWDRKPASVDKEFRVTTDVLYTSADEAFGAL